MRAMILTALMGMGLAPLDGVDGSRAARVESRTLAFKEAKFLIEHNATDEDTGFQAFVDGEPWKELEILNPQGQVILEVESQGKLRKLGLTELFFETQEPANDEVPIGELLALMPPGRYGFKGTSVTGQPMRGAARLTHDIPAGPVIVSPREGAVVDPDNVAIDWRPVTKSVTGGSVDIVAYQLIVEKDVPDRHPEAFAKIKMSVHVPPSVTRVTVPREFLQPGTPYAFEVLAIEKSGNQTISSSAFRTR